MDSRSEQPFEPPVDPSTNGTTADNPLVNCAVNQEADRSFDIREIEPKNFTGKGQVVDPVVGAEISMAVTSSNGSRGLRQREHPDPDVVIWGIRLGLPFHTSKRPKEFRGGARCGWFALPPMPSVQPDDPGSCPSRPGGTGIVRQ